MRRRVILPLLLALLFAVPAARAAQVKFGNASVHDPSVLYADGMYYIYGSHMQAAKSSDLQDWLAQEEQRLSAASSVQMGVWKVISTSTES